MFTPKQLERLELFIRHPDEISHFRRMAGMFFPFMVSEVKSENMPFSLADRAILNPIGVCRRGIVNLFKIVSREAELHQQFLGFLIVHNILNVNIYAHYLIITERQVTFHHRLIQHIFLSEIIGDEK
ncbi:hypothetical protein BJY01DRAFT_246478 [Aspergillus pseudoustus]|uniref:DUF7924 domain-containing protein n=1 Tax=Aspergillus pseudoustus TaxID=1810923 RepID=A0ABR4K774_9EURO